MSAPYSLDLRQKVILAYKNGVGTQKDIAKLFSISETTLREWLVLQQRTGELKPKEYEYRGRKPVIEERGSAFIKRLIENKPDILIIEIQKAYKNKFRVEVAQSMVSRALNKLNLRRKKKSHYAQEQEREDVKKREYWKKEVMSLNANNLIFIDESGANLRMESSYARAEGGGRVKMPVPFNRGPQISMIGAVSTEKVEAALYGEWSTNGEIFLTFIETQLVPELKAKHIVVMDNVKFHLQKSVSDAIESTGATVIFLPPYSPDFSPIEHMWSKIKNRLRKLAPRTMKEFKKSIQIAFKEINKSDLLSWFKHCGYRLGLNRIPL